jgi:hypothetical protein
MMVLPHKVTGKTSGQFKGVEADDEGGFVVLFGLNGQGVTVGSIP